jgi:peptidoglycan/xylan/chitin deacetylase (PgdA/CDA1 family)
LASCLVTFVLLLSGLVATGEEPAAAPPRTMAVTVDDLPAPYGGLTEMTPITEGVLAALRRHGVTAVGFVNESRLEPAGERDARLALLRSWVRDGHDLGNHTRSHPDLQRVPVDEYERDVLQGEPGIREVLAEHGRSPRFFRHPYTHTGPTLEVRLRFESFLAAHGYAVAPFSIENADYVFDRARRSAVAAGDEASAERILEAYVAYTASVTEQMEALSRETFGREVPQILLIHANRINSDALDEMLAAFAGRGYRFVPLQEALGDDAWKTPDEYVGPRGPSWLFRFRLARGLPLDLEKEPDPPQWVLDLYRKAAP